MGDHRSTVEDLHEAMAGRQLGIVSGDHLVRIKVLDPRLGLHAGMNDFAALLGQLRRLGWQPQFAFVFGHLEMVLAITPHPGAVVIFGSGYALGVLGFVPRLENIPIPCRGDLYSRGFAVPHGPVRSIATLSQSSWIRKHY